MNQYPAWQQKIRERQAAHRAQQQREEQEREAAEKALIKEMAEDVRKAFSAAGIDLPESDTADWDLDGFKISAFRERHSIMCVSVRMPVPGADLEKPIDWFDEGYQVSVSRTFMERELKYSHDLAVRLADAFDELPKELEAAIATNARIAERYQTMQATEATREDGAPVRSAPYWDVITLTDDPTSHTGDCSDQIAEYLNSGWEIVAINFAQCHVDDGTIDYTRVTTFKKLITPSVDPEPVKRAAVEVEVIAEVIPSPVDVDEETVIEFAPVPDPVTRVLPANIRVLSADGKPLVQFADGVSVDTPYEDAIQRIDVDAEQLEAIHQAETEKRVNERLAAFRAGEITFEEAVAAAGIRAAQAIKDDLKFEAIRQKYAGNMAEWMKAAPGFARG